MSYVLLAEPTPPHTGHSSTADEAGSEFHRSKTTSAGTNNPHFCSTPAPRIFNRAAQQLHHLHTPHLPAIPNSTLPESPEGELAVQGMHVRWPRIHMNHSALAAGFSTTPQTTPQPSVFHRCPTRGDVYFIDMAVKSTTAIIRHNTHRLLPIE